MLGSYSAYYSEYVNLIKSLVYIQVNCGFVSQIDVISPIVSVLRTFSCVSPNPNTSLGDQKKGGKKQTSK